MKKFVISLVLSALLFSQFSFGGLAETQQPDKNISDEEINKLAQIGHFYEEYLIYKQNEYVSDEVKMNANKLTQNQKQEIREYSVVKNEYDNSQITTYAKKKMYHGRYCGKGDIGGKPIDALDRACYEHDKCYAKYGWGKCKCDKPFIKKTAAIWKNKRYSKHIRNKARNAGILFATGYARCGGRH
ncbi:hypothetical protein [Staphylococcus shinii]|uniref:hypothetical protein n=1 Tax=Staphylococcus shinii TaxID=2912228 RepID=UPI00057BEB1F|nr:hypothetical protein [Staphylococcus shinii]